MKTKAGDKIVFKGYSEDPPEGEAFLTEGQEYEVVEVNAAEKAVVVRIDNPDFNAKRKEDDEKNPKTLLLDVFEEEFEAAESEEPPKRTSRAKAATSKAKAASKKAAPKQEEEQEEEEEAPPKAKAKTKAAPKKKAATKAKTKTKAAPKKAAKTDEEPADPYGDLSEDQEDEEILGLVNEAGDEILDLAREVSEEANAIEYKLGGVLFHVRKSGAYKELDDRYKEKGGFGLYVLECLNVEYRKAMYLIDIYYKWNKFGLEADKVAQIGWAKASKIAAVMDEDNADELLELAEESTVADLVANIKESYKEAGGTKGEKKKMTTFRFRLFEDQGPAVQEVLETCAGSMGFEKLDAAFEHIIMEWAAEHLATDKPKARAEKKAPARRKAKA